MQNYAIELGKYVKYMTSIHRKYIYTEVLRSSENVIAF